MSFWEVGPETEKFLQGNSLQGEVAPLLKLNWSIENFPIGKFCMAKFPIGESGVTSKTGLALGFCGDSFSASSLGGEVTVVSSPKVV
jgi:hypothetical protein